MHRLLVTISLLLLPLIAGCAGFTNPLTGTTVGGGVVANTSRLLGTPLPAGMEFYAEHSRIEGQDGMETLRGTASPAMCARTVCDALQADGWAIRLGYATETRALYAFEKQGRPAPGKPDPHDALHKLRASGEHPHSLYQETRLQLRLRKLVFEQHAEQ